MGEQAAELYRITYDGSIADEPHFVVMGGTTEPIISALKDSYSENAPLEEAVRISVEALRTGIASVTGGPPRLPSRGCWGRRLSRWRFSMPADPPGVPAYHQRGAGSATARCRGRRPLLTSRRQGTPET